METAINLFAALQLWLFETIGQPVMFSLGLAQFLEDGFTGTGWFLVGVLELMVLLVVIAPLQRWRPVEPVIDSQTVRTDVIYTLIHRLGLFRVAMFFALDPVFDQLLGAARLAGWSSFHLDDLWPGVTDRAWVSFLLYLVVLDFVNYWVHRGQHQWQWWWNLHSLHHAQRQMTMWSDNRNHLLDDVLRDGIVVLVAQLIGIAPEQFVAVVALTQLSESFQHANLRLWFGPIGERLWVSPRFHRLHHSVGLGHEFAASRRPAGAAAKGRPEQGSAPSGGSEPREAGSVGASATAKGRPEQGSAPSGGSEPREAGSAGATAAAKGRPEQGSAPSGGSGPREAGSVGASVLGGANFGVLLPWWDVLFGTGNFEYRFDRTGVRDQVEQGRDYGSGFWSQQWQGLKRLAGRA